MKKSFVATLVCATLALSQAAFAQASTATSESPTQSPMPASTPTPAPIAPMGGPMFGMMSPNVKPDVKLGSAIATAEKECHGQARGALLRQSDKYGLVWNIMLMGDDGHPHVAMVDAKKGQLIDAISLPDNCMMGPHGMHPPFPGHMMQGGPMSYEMLERHKQMMGTQDGDTSSQKP